MEPDGDVPTASSLHVHEVNEQQAVSAVSKIALFVQRAQVGEFLLAVSAVACQPVASAVASPRKKPKLPKPRGEVRQGTKRRPKVSLRDYAEHLARTPARRGRRPQMAAIAPLPTALQTTPHRALAALALARAAGAVALEGNPLATRTPAPRDMAAAARLAWGVALARMAVAVFQLAASASLECPQAG